jgi:hypothetical protein
MSPPNWSRLIPTSDFLHLLEQVLRQRRLPFSRASAIAFVESAWPLIEDDPDVWYWSDRFIEEQAAVSTADVEVK